MVLKNHQEKQEKFSTINNNKNNHRFHVIFFLSVLFL